MKRGFWNGKRMLAAALAVSLVLGEPSAVYASGMYPEGGEGADSVQAGEIVSANDAQTVEEMPDVQPTEDVQDNEQLTPQNAVSGALSQVIGVKGSHSIDDEGVCRVTFTWKSLTSPQISAQDAAGNYLEIGYEVRINGKSGTSATEMSEANGTKHFVVDKDAYCRYVMKEPVPVGSSVTAEIRGVYYYVTGSGEYRISSFGPWSEPETYVVKQKTMVPAVTGVAAQVVQTKKKTIRISWNPLPEAAEYSVYFIDTDKELNLAVGDFGDLWNRKKAAREKHGIGNGFLYSDRWTCNGRTSLELDWGEIHNVAHKGKYHYFAVIPRGVADAALYENAQSEYTVTAVAKAVTTWDEEDDNYTYAPAVQNFKAERMSDGDIALTWTPQNREVLIYVYDSPQFPDWFHYNELMAYREGGSLWNDLGSKQRAKLNKVRCIKVAPTSEEGEKGSIKVGYKLALIPDRTYYFVAYTYAGAGPGGKTPITYSFKDPSGKTVTYNYDDYNTFSAPSATVSASRKLTEPDVSISASKNSLKLTMGTGNGYKSGYVTGYEIYRKSGKKYKKIATITSDTYTDTDLKANTKYSYKVRSYYYDTDSKTKYYSQYKVADARTGAVGNISLTAVEKSQTSVKLKWTRVAGAVKYEIYRTYSDQHDPKNISKEDRPNDTAYAISNSRYELVKTINKQKMTTYTDKKLTAGETYTYKVIAYVKNGAQTEAIETYTTIALKLRTPYNVKTKVSGSAVKVTWDADKYASRYELEYTVYDKNGKEKTDSPVKASTKKNAYTIKNIGMGEYVSIRIRAYGKNKTYSNWKINVTSDKRSLAQVKNVKAANVKEKLSSGKTVDAVKITWKPVSGAKYYKVYRSTTEGRYDEDKKLWQKSSDAELIAAEGNDNWLSSNGSSDDGYRYHHEVYYNQYYGVEGSVTGTSVVDYSSDLKKGVTYYYTVIACGDITNGSTTGKSFVESAGCSKAAAVTYASDIKVKAKSAGKGKVKLTYNKVSGAKKYVIYRAQKKNGKYTVIGSTKKTNYTDKKTKKGKTYYYKIVATGTNALKADLKTTSAPKKIKVKK